MLDLKLITPKGWEVVDYRFPREGESYLWSSSGGACSLHLANHGLNHTPALIVQRERWRAEEGGGYWFIDLSFVTQTTVDWRKVIDDRLYESGNYFRSQMVAERAAEVMKKSLEEFCILGEKK